MKSYKITIGNGGSLGFFLNKTADDIRCYTITGIHKSQINAYPEDVIGSYLLFINGHSVFDKDKEFIRKIIKLKNTCVFYYSNDKSEILKIQKSF